MELKVVKCWFYLFIIMDEYLLEELNILEFSFHTKDELKLYHGFQVKYDFEIIPKIADVFNFEFVNIESTHLNGRFLLVSYSIDFDTGEDLFRILLAYAKGLNGLFNEDNYKNIYLTCKKFKFKNKSVIGLIGELAFIYNKVIKEDYKVIDMWHADVNDTFDFYNSEYIFEVKTTKSIIRKHTINYIQLTNLVNSEVNRKAYLVSLQLFKSDEAHTLGDLVDLIKSKLNTEKLSIFLNKLEFYSDLLKNEYRFNVNDLIGSMKYFIPSTLPSVQFDRGQIDEENLKFIMILENLNDEILM